MSRRYEIRRVPSQFCWPLHTPYEGTPPVGEDYQLWEASSNTPLTDVYPSQGHVVAASYRLGYSWLGTVYLDTPREVQKTPS